MKSFIVQNQNDNGAVGSRIPDRVPNSLSENIPPLKFSEFVRGLECPEILRLEAQEKTHLVVQKCKHALSLWKVAGYPDLGEWPDKRMGLLDYTCETIFSVIKQ